MNDMVQKVAEDKILPILLDLNHLFLLLGVFAIILTMRWIPQLNILFSEKYKGLVALINGALSFCGIFLFNMTSAKTSGMKVVIAATIMVAVTFTYEAIYKNIIVKIPKLMGKIMEKFFGKDKNPEKPAT